MFGQCLANRPLTWRQFFVNNCSPWWDGRSFLNFEPHPVRCIIIEAKRIGMRVIASILYLWYLTMIRRLFLVLGKTRYLNSILPFNHVSGSRLCSLCLLYFSSFQDFAQSLSIQTSIFLLNLGCVWYFGIILRFPPSLSARLPDSPEVKLR